jgi:cell surface protein SprA
MFAHLNAPPETERGDLQLFLRIGTDYQENYYEYRLPLKKTATGATNRDSIWPEENEIDLALREFYDLKLQRIRENFPQSQRFEQVQEDGRLLAVKGNPDMSNIRAVMIGVRNPPALENPQQDDGMAKSGNVWVNELRLSGFDNEGGWAAITNVKTKLADFGELNFTGNRTTIGFGQIEESLNERSLEDVTGYDVSTRLQLGQFFGKRGKVKLPMFYSYGQTYRRPKFDPLNPDLLLENSIEAAPTEEEENDILEVAQDVTTREALNFTNVRVAVGSEGNPKIYDPKNFNLTYSYNRTNRRNAQLKFDELINRRVQLGYNYNFVDSKVEPFKNLSNSKALDLITDFNFNYLPSSFGVTANFNRRFNRKLFRSNGQFESPQDTLYNKNFTFGRTYNLNYRLTESLNLTYTANASAVIDEPPGRINTAEKRDSVWENVRGGGRLTNFNQTTNLTYNLPLRKLPGLDFLNGNTSYTGTFQWATAPPAQQDLGNSINNSQNIQFNGQANFVSLYNKSKFLRTVNQGKTNIPRLKKEKARRLRREREQARKEREQKDGEKEQEGEKEPGPVKAEVNEPLIKGVEALSRVLMAVRNVSANYSINRATNLPGFTPTPSNFGQDLEQNAPGWGYVFGAEDDILQNAIDNRWLADSSFSSFRRSEGTQLNIRATVEPIRDLRINLEWRRQENENFNTRVVRNVFGEFERQAPVEGGNYSISFGSWPTAFFSTGENGFTQAFDDFEANRRPIAERLGGQNGIDPVTGYPRGYDSTSQDVLIPAFIAAYTGQSANSVDLSPFPERPAPNWRVSYRGLSRLSFMEDLVRSVTINHSYRSSYNVGNYQTALDPVRSLDSIDAGETFDPNLQINAISITEQFSPLIGVDISWQNNWNTRFEYKTSRTLSFNINNSTLNKNLNNEFVIGAGYRTQEFVLPFKVGGRKAVLKNDLNFRFDFKIRENLTSIKRLDEQVETPTSGTWVMNIQPNVQYTLNKNLTLTIFFDRQVTNPKVENSFETRFTSFGFKLRYVLSP